MDYTTPRGHSRRCPRHRLEPIRGQQELANRTVAIILGSRDGSGPISKPRTRWPRTPLGDLPRAVLVRWTPGHDRLRPRQPASTTVITEVVRCKITKRKNQRPIARRRDDVPGRGDEALRPTAILSRQAAVVPAPATSEGRTGFAGVDLRLPQRAIGKRDRRFLEPGPCRWQSQNLFLKQ